MNINRMATKLININIIIPFTVALIISIGNVHVASVLVMLFFNMILLQAYIAYLRHMELSYIVSEFNKNLINSEEDCPEIVAHKLLQEKGLILIHDVLILPAKVDMFFNIHFYISARDIINKIVNYYQDDKLLYLTTTEKRDFIKLQVYKKV